MMTPGTNGNRGNGISTMATLLIAMEDYEGRALLAAEAYAAGFETVEAETGLEALELTERLAPDVVLLDLRLAIFDGIEACSRLRANPDIPRELPIILVAESAPDARMVERAGADDVLLRRHGREELREMLCRYLGTFR